MNSENNLNEIKTIKTIQKKIKKTRSFLSGTFYQLFNPVFVILNVHGILKNLDEWTEGSAEIIEKGGLCLFSEKNKILKTLSMVTVIVIGFLYFIICAVIGILNIIQYFKVKK